MRSVYTAAALYLETVLECLRAMAAALTTETTHYVPYCLARAAMEAGSQAFWLLEPGIGARRRVVRLMLLRASSARRLAMQQRTAAAGSGPDSDICEREAAAAAAGLGLRCEYNPRGQYRGDWRCEGDKLPGYTERNQALEESMFVPGAYSIYSAALHAEWHSVSGSWREVITADGMRGVTTRSDREAVWGAVLIAAGPAVTPATRAFQVLGYPARRAEIVYWIDNALDLMRRMDLPRHWWWIDRVR